MKAKLTLLISTSMLIVGCATSTSDHLSQGMIYVNQNDYNSAIIEFKEEVSKNPTSVAYANLGAAYMKVGKNNLAMEALKQGEALNPKDTTLTYNMTALYSLMDQPDLALVYLDKTMANGFSNYDAIRFDPDLANLRGEPEFRSILEKYKVFL